MSDSTPKVVGLRGDYEREKREYDAALIQRIEEMLDQAKRGEIVSFAGCFVRANGYVTTVLELRQERFALSHAIGALYFRFHQQMHDEAFDPREGS